jgi:uncharacterized protein
MARGFLGGIVIGGIFSVAVAAVVSFVVPMGPPPQMADTAPAPMETAEPAIAPVQPTPEEPAPVAEPAPVTAMSVPEAETPPGAEDVAAPPAAPELTQTLEMEQPADPAEPAAPQMTPDEPIFPNPMALAPMEPSAPDAVAIAPAPAEPQPPVTATDPAGNSAPDAEPADDRPVAEVAPEAPDAPLVAENPAETPEPAAPAEGRPTVGVPAAITAERDTGVTVNRLPTALAPEQKPDAPAAASPVAAIKRFGQPFVNPDDKPLMSILLIDQGSDLEGGEVGIAALRSFPYPISFAVDVSLPDAADRMTIYRNEGFEVMAMVDLPEGAQPSDAETTLAVAFNRLPEVIGVLEGLGAGLQPDRAVADQVTAILGQGGYGLVTQDKGLNTMPKLAVKEGVPAAPIFRDFDSKDQTPTVIRRFLDQAAFKAGLEGSVIMLGRMRPETISALLVWGLQDRASQVSLAPISAVLLASDGE